MYKVTLSLTYCDRLDGGSNLFSKNPRLWLNMEEVDLWEHVVKDIPKPTNLVYVVTY